MEKPKNVLLAVNLLWASLSIGLIRALLGLTGTTAQSPRTALGVFLATFILIFIFTLIAFLTLKISAGKNWARITSLILFLLGAPQTLYHLPATVHDSIIIGIISILQAVLQVCALFLVFTNPGSEWFNGNARLSTFEQARLNRLHR